MRKMLLTTVSALALGLGGVAIAQESTDTTTTDEIQTEDLNLDTGTDTELGADTDLDTGLDTDMDTDVDLGATETDMDADTMASALGGYSADELIGSSVMGADGDEIAEVSDLVLDNSDQVTNVLVDVGGFLGIGSKVVALDPNSIQVSQDDSGEPMITTSMTQEELESMQSYELEGDYRLQSEIGSDVDATTDTMTTE